MSYDDPNCEECNEERRVYDGGQGAIDAYREGMRQAVREAQFTPSELASTVLDEQQKWLRAKHEADVAKFRELARAVDTLCKARDEYLARGGKLYIVPNIFPAGSTAGLRSDDPRVPPHNPEVEGDGS